MIERGISRDQKHHTAHGLFFTLLVIVFVTEVLTNAIANLFHLPTIQESFLDATLMILLAYPVLFVLIFRPLAEEIAERKEVEKLLRYAKEQAELLFRITPSAIFTLDKESRITSWNDKATEITGYSREEVMDKPCSVFTDLPCSEKCDLHGNGMPKPVIGRECYLKAKNGKILTILKNTDYLKDKNGVIIGLIESFQDITERKRIEDMKDEFIGTVSHELRTPLSITKEGLSLVLDKIPGPINDQQGRILTISKNNIDRLTRIINSLLDISRIEAGKLPIKLNTFDIISVTRQVMALFEIKIKDKGLELKDDLPKGTVMVHGDADAITQVLTNLVGNALKFTGQGYISVAARDSNDRIEFSITDTGIGILKEDMPKLFNKFQQFGRINGPGEKGTGLGLVIAKGIISAHNGRIWAESEPGKGTKITFTLPKNRA